MSDSASVARRSNPPRTGSRALTGRGARKHRVLLLSAAGLRAALASAVIPLAPFLYRDHFAVLEFFRPTKEVMLAGGFLLRRGDLALPVVVLAALPILLLGVWLFYFVGRAYADEIQSGKGLPKWAGRLLPTKRIQHLGRVLDKKGSRVIFVGRLAAFPSSLLAAAAGASGMDPKRFLLADGLGAVVSMVEVIGVGYALGAAYKQAGPWLLAVGVAAIVVIVVAVGRSLRRTS